MSSCDNCGQAGSQATHFSLELDTRGDGRRELEVDLCEHCGTDFLSLDWIQEQDVSAAG